MKLLLNFVPGIELIMITAAISMYAPRIVQRKILAHVLVQQLSNLNRILYHVVLVLQQTYKQNCEKLILIPCENMVIQ